MRRLARAVAWIGLVVLAALAWSRVRPKLRPAPPPPSAAAFAHREHVRIVRDRYGVPHIFGDTDADTAFGLAYAEAEDDFQTMQMVLAAARGQLGLVLFDTQALIADYYVRLLRVSEQVDAAYAALDPRTQALLEGYAAGINYYASTHPKEADSRVFPMRAEDIAAGFVQKLSIMVGVPEVLEALTSSQGRALGELVFADGAAMPERSRFPGSNAHAVARGRSGDDVTRLNINSHQPWEGPVTWYEAHLVSKEGLDITGGTFPGAPFILHGHNAHLGWAHTVNYPDLIDVYRLETDQEHPGQYLLDGTWRPVEVKTARLVLDVGVADVAIHKEVLWSELGPVMATAHGLYAVRYAGIFRGLGAIEQWYRMNRAQNLDEFKDAMRILGVPMFNTVYADREHIFYVYNALIPKRRPGPDYRRVLPGNDSTVVFRDYLGFDELPQVLDPPAGFLQACNSTPFSATAGEGNPLPEQFPAEAGIERTETNRALRSLALLSRPGPISREDFLSMKWDRRYDPRSELRRRVIEPLISSYRPRDADEQRGLEILRAFDGLVTETSTAALLPILVFRECTSDTSGAPTAKRTDPVAGFQRAVRWLKDHHYPLDVPLGTVQRLRRGKVDLPLGGGPDVLNAAYAKKDGDHTVGYQGDSYVLEVEFGPEGARSQSIHQYGASCRPESPHYADQAPLFLAHQLKPTLRGPGELEAATERSYRPGD